MESNVITFSIEQLYRIQNEKEPKTLWNNKDGGRVYRTSGDRKVPEELRKKVLHIFRVNTEQKMAIWFEHQCPEGSDFEAIETACQNIGLCVFW